MGLSKCKVYLSWLGLGFCGLSSATWGILDLMFWGACHVSQMRQILVQIHEVLAGLLSVDDPLLVGSGFFTRIEVAGLLPFVGFLVVHIRMIQQLF